MIAEILTKKPFARVTPEGYLQGRITSDLRNASFTNNSDRLTWQLISQADFIREFYPSGHKINSELFYPDRLKYDEEKKRFFREKVFRASFPFQMIITIQQLVHLCGNDIHHELTDTKVDESSREIFLEFQKGWLDKNMEIAFYEYAKSVKITGDAAIVFYMNEGKVFTKNLSYFDGDTLYPHYDSITGQMTLFARRYSDYDEEGKELISWVEVWDNKKMYRYRQDKRGIAGAINKVKQYFGIEGYTLVEEHDHGFTECPVVYYRDKHGACWSFSQDNIDKYELAISHLCQNNMAYAFPIMLLKGEDVEIQGDMYGAVKAITMGKDDDAGFMNRPEASQSFELQINTLLKMIFMGSFVVMPPEVKSGDLPGVAIKLIYSPSLEKAMIDCKEFDESIDKMKRLFLHGYGTEKGQLTKFLNLKIFSWAVPY
ncbi:phage portal protein, partial [Phocaeicola vulgatus]